MSEPSPPNILIAEDNKVSREMMAGILKNAGYRTILAADGDEAIQLVGNTERINLALVDINMAPKGGFELVKHIAAEQLPIPCVIITGDDASDILVEANAYGVKQVYQKPVEPDRLLKTVERILERYKAPTSPTL